MKKICFLTAWILVMTSNIGKAQVAVGVKLGLNASTQSELGQLYYNNDFKGGILGGLQVEYRFHSIVSAQIEGNYIAKGCKTNFEGQFSSNQITRDYSYLSVPILLKFRFGTKLNLPKGYRFFSYAGPYVATLLSSSEKFEHSNTDDSYIEVEANDYDFGLVFGGGLTHVLKSKNELFIDIRYDMGLATIIEDYDQLRNKTISLSFGYRFL